MFKLTEKPTSYFDVDNTLVFAWSDIDDDLKSKLQQIYFGSEMFYVHYGNVQKLKELKSRGHNIVVWSAGGADWAEAVVYKLGIEGWVDVVAPKPAWYFDDLPVEDWIGRRCYSKLKDNDRGF